MPPQVIVFLQTWCDAACGRNASEIAARKLHQPLLGQLGCKRTSGWMMHLSGGNGAAGRMASWRQHTWMHRGGPSEQRSQHHTDPGKHVMDRTRGRPRQAQATAGGGMPRGERQSCQYRFRCVCPLQPTQPPEYRVQRSDGILPVHMSQPLGLRRRIQIGTSKCGPQRDLDAVPIGAYVDRQEALDGLCLDGLCLVDPRRLTGSARALLRHFSLRLTKKRRQQDRVSASADMLFGATRKSLCSAAYERNCGPIATRRPKPRPTAECARM
jgi:hypothetical protein